ncbi:MAG: hypothetical protein ACTHMG_10410 [Sphingomonas sp.]
MAKALETFTITPSTEGYLLHIEDEEGEVTELTANYDQLDLIAEELDGVLDADEEGELEVDEDEDDELPE